MSKLAQSLQNIDIEKEMETISKRDENKNEKLIIQTDETSDTKNDYSAISKHQASVEINLNTKNFDLYKGLIFMFLSCIFKSLFSILAKYCLKYNPDMSSFQLLTFRTFFMLWITIAICAIIKINVFSPDFVQPDKVKYVVLRTICGNISISLLVYTLKLMHISDVYSVYYIYPGFIVLLSLIFLKREKLKLFDFICLFACFLGALLIVKPNFIFNNRIASTDNNGYLFALVVLAAFVKAIEDVTVRNIGKKAHFLIFPFMYSIFGMVVFATPMYLFDTTYPILKYHDFILLFFIAVCTYLYQTFMALGLQNESAGRVSMVNYVQVALMYVSDLLLFDKSFEVFDLLGTLLIFGFNLTNGLLKALKRHKELKVIRKQSQIQIE